MSGIYGIINLKGNPVDKEQMDKMETLIIHRGVDGKAQWIDNNVGLGHLKLEITPESEYETLPLRYKQWIITADCRIDNRDELDEPLSISEEERPVTPDSTYIVKAYEKWGKDCVQHLIGDFAFAIWDTVEQSLFCARDHIGIKPFFYVKTEDKFIFASELKTIVELREIPVELNESKFGDWMYRIQDLHNPTETLFTNIKRLMPAHFATVQNNGLHFKKYWELQKTKEIIFKNEEDYPKKLRELMIQAVECRMRTKYNIGVTLSGGLDSSSVACIAARKLAKEGKVLYTASSVLPKDWEGIESDERQFIEEILNQEKNIKNDFLTILPNDFFKDLKENLKRVYFPINPFYNMDNALANQISKEHQAKILLSGFAGDMGVSQKANTLLAFLISKKEWRAALKLLKQRIQNKENKTNIIKELISPFLPNIIKSFYHKTNNFFNPQNPYSYIFNIDFINRYNLENRKKEFFDKTKISPIDNIKFAFNTSISDFEEINIQHANHHLEQYIPFADIRLLEFISNMPAQYFQIKGLKRGLIRLAMDKILPPAIQFRPDKIGFMPNFNRNVLSIKKMIYSDILSNTDILLFIKPNAIKKFLNDGYIFKSWASKNYSPNILLISIQIINIYFFNFLKFNNEQSFKSKSK